MKDLATVKDFIALDLKLKALEGEVKRVKAERDMVEATLLSQFEQEGLQNVRIGDIPMPVMEHEEFLSNWRGFGGGGVIEVCGVPCYAVPVSVPRSVTAYLHTQLWASAKKDAEGNPLWEPTCAALKAEGQGWMVRETVNTQTLSAWVRELPRDEAGMPILSPPLADTLEVVPRHSIRVRKTS